VFGEATRRPQCGTDSYLGNNKKIDEENEEEGKGVVAD
jgi:hypothetical protein